jgi:hypothetical protein
MVEFYTTTEEVRTVLGKSLSDEELKEELAGILNKRGKKDAESKS